MPSCVDEGVSQIQEPILRWLREIYNDRASSSLSALALRLAQRIVPSERSTPSNKGKWDQGTCLLITYADSVIEDKSYSPIASLGRFCDAYLDDVAPPEALRTLKRWNKRYWRTAAIAMFLSLANIILSAMFLFQNYRSSATATACASFALLVLMKLYGSFSRARRDNKEQRARSAFLTEDCSFNVMDEDYNS